MADEEKYSGGFPPIVGKASRVLVLGSLPGVRSIEAAEYYAHPRNAFWRIMAELCGAKGSYKQRCAALELHGIAVWDVLARSIRSGSLDANIDMKSAKINDFNHFLGRHKTIERICFNGQKAAKIFTSDAFYAELEARYEFRTLPSTSPAHAAMSFDEKLARWRSGIGL